MTTGFRGPGQFRLMGAAVAVAIGAVIAARTAAAQAPQAFTVDVGECVEIAAPDERFACYERRVAAARNVQAQSEATLNGTPALAPPELQPTTTAPRGSSFDRRTVAGDAQESRDFIGIVASLRETVPDSYLITLDNGQVWRQTTAKRYPLQPGQQVRIYPTTWGDSFRLATADSKGFIQVRRVQ
jgi:hypothetical protein